MRFRVNSPRVAHETVDGEAVIIDLESGAYYNTEGSGADLWSRLVEGAGGDETVAWALAHFAGPRADIEKGTRRFLADLEREELIVAVDSSDEADSAPDEMGAGASGDSAPPFVVPVLHKYTDMQELLLLDPIHEVAPEGWPVKKS